MRSKITVATVLGVVLCWIVAGGSASGAGHSTPVIRWGLFKNYNPVYVAQQLNYFKQAGVKVKLTGTFTSGPAVVQAAGTGDIDAGHSATTGLVNAIASGIKVIGIADSQTEFANAPLMQWYVLNDSPIRSGKDLKGKRIGVNTLSGSFYYTALIYLHRNGLTKDDVRFVVIPHQNQEQALRSHQIDVAGLIDPYSVHLAQAGGTRVLFRGVDVIGARQFSLIFFRRDFVTKYPDVVRRFVKAYRRAIKFIQDNPRRSSQLMGKEIGVAANLNGTHRFTSGAHVRMKNVQFWLDLMRQEGDLKDDGRLEPTDIATTRFTGTGQPTKAKPKAKSR
jgi:ABC-type nitrate/sulfonate/bicarbonate transport system substrate-binding protein